MADKTTNGADSTAPAGPEAIRNVVLVGPPGGGKTTLTEALLLAAGAIQRAGTIADGTTVCDYDPAEIRQQRSIGLAVAPLRYDGIKINLLDTPGYADFVGELRAGLRAADCALFVIAANEGVDPATRLLWRECDEVGMPRAVVISKLDHQRADYEQVLKAAQSDFGGRVLPLYLPVAEGLIGLLSQQRFTYQDGRRVVTDAEPVQLDQIADPRSALIEGIIEESEDETLMERYLDGEQIDQSTLIGDLEQAMARGSLHPVLPACAATGVGTMELLEVITRGFPSPVGHPLPEVYTPVGGKGPAVVCDPAGPLVAEVVKTTSDPYVGRVSLIRVFSGTLRPDSAVHVSGHFQSFFGTQSSHQDHDEDDRIGALSSAAGKVFRPTPEIIAGDLGAIGRLSHAETGDTLSAREQPLVLQPWTMPEPLLPIAIQAHSKTDDEKLAEGLARLSAEDPTLRIENNSETHQIVLWCMGEAHADVVLERLRTRYAAVDVVELQVALRETLAEPTRGLGRHVKQSGGHGQYAVCQIEVEPLDSEAVAAGHDLEFVDKVVGGAVPRQFIPSVQKGIKAQMERGVETGYPMVGIRVTLLDGKAHSVDSSDMAFQAAGALALRAAVSAASIKVLEPVDTVAVVVPDELVGPVMSDLTGRRGRVLGSEQIGAGQTRISAEVPALEISRYCIDLRSISHGAAWFSREFARYEPMPDHLAGKFRTLN